MIRQIQIQFLVIHIILLLRDIHDIRGWSIIFVTYIDLLHTQASSAESGAELREMRFRRRSQAQSFHCPRSQRDEAIHLSASVMRYNRTREKCMNNNMTDSISNQFRLLEILTFLHLFDFLGTQQIVVLNIPSNLLNTLDLGSLALLQFLLVLYRQLFEISICRQR